MKKTRKLLVKLFAVLMIVSHMSFDGIMVLAEENSASTITKKQIILNLGTGEFEHEDPEQYVGKVISGTGKSVTWSITTSNASKTYSKANLDAVIKTKKVTLGDVQYSYNGVWADENGNLYDNGIKLDCTQFFKGEYADKEVINLYFYPVYTKSRSIEFVIHFGEIEGSGISEINDANYYMGGMLAADGTRFARSTSNKLSPGTSWTANLTKTANNFVTNTKVEANGVKYELVKWVDIEGNDMPEKLSLNPAAYQNDEDGVVDIYFFPVYEKSYAKLLNIEYIDNISTASGSWKNGGSVTGYSHVMKQPDAQLHYQFIEWLYEDEDQTFLPGAYKANEKYAITAEMINSITTIEAKEIKFYAMYQPSVTVVYHYLDNTAVDVEEYRDITLYEAEFDHNGLDFAGWFDANGNRMSEDAIISLPAVTSEKVERKVVDVYAKYNVTVVAENAEKVYGSADPEFTAKVNGIAADDEISFTLERISGENVGEYTITTSGEANQGKYIVKFVDAELLISPLDIVVRINGNKTEEIYNGNEQAVEGYSLEISNDLYDEENIEFNGNKEAFGTNVGTYSMNLQAEDFANNNDNFTVVFEIAEDGILEIAPKEILVKVNDYSKLDNEADPEFSALVEGLLNEETIEYAIEREAGNKAGSYELKAIGEEEQGNYIVKYENGTLTIKASPVQRTTTEETPVVNPEIEDNNQENVIETIDVEELPLALGTGAWSLIDVLSMLLSAIITIGMILSYFRKKDDEKIERNGLKFLAIIPAVVAVVVVILTQNLHLQMVLTDRWSVLMVAQLVIVIVLACLTRNEKEEEETATETVSA